MLSSKAIALNEHPTPLTGELAKAASGIDMTEIEQLVSRLRLDPSDNGGPSRMDMTRERKEAADLIENLSRALRNAQATCDKAMACITRWESGKQFDAAGPEASMKGELYDVIRPGARAGIRKLNDLINQHKQS